jgi:hypothetical protein
MRYAIIWFSLAGLLLIAFAVSLRGQYGILFVGVRLRQRPPSRRRGSAL